MVAGDLTLQLPQIWQEQKVPSPGQARSLNRVQTARNFCYNSSKVSQLELNDPYTSVALFAFAEKEGLKRVELVHLINTQCFLRVGEH